MKQKYKIHKTKGDFKSMTKTYYATASKDNKHFVINNLTGTYPAAERQAKQECAKQGIAFQQLHLIGGKNETASTMTKKFKERRAKGQK